MFFLQLLMRLLLNAYNKTNLLCTVPLMESNNYDFPQCSTICKVQRNLVFLLYFVNLVLASKIFCLKLMLSYPAFAADLLCAIS